MDSPEVKDSMFKYFYKKASKLGFAGLELILLITILAGIAAASRLALQNQSLQNQAQTSCIKNACLPVGKTCCAGYTQIPEYTCPGTNKACASGLPTCNTGNCYNDCLCKGNTPSECNAACISGGGSYLPTKTPTPRPGGCLRSGCITSSQNCCVGYEPKYNKNCGSALECVYKSTTGGGATGEFPCRWVGTQTNGSCQGTPPSDCYYGDCLYIGSCKPRSYANCIAVKCEKTAEQCAAGPVGGEPLPGGGDPGTGEPPPDGGITGGGFNDCSAYPGTECKKVGNCTTGCPAEGCGPCTKPNEPGECCPLPADVPPADQPPADQPPPEQQIAICSSDSFDASCQGIAENTDCTGANGIPDICRKAVSGTTGGDENPICYCGASPPAATDTPAPTPTPTIPDPDKPHWYAPGNLGLCTSQTFRTYFADSDCRDKIGFQTENLPNPVPCDDESKICYKAGGDKITDKKPNSYTVGKDPACITEIDVQNPEIFKSIFNTDTPFVCSFELQPSGKISVKIKVNAQSQSQVTRVAVKIEDTTDITDNKVYIENRDFNNSDTDTTNDIKVNDLNDPTKFVFENLFNDHTYKVYARAFEGIGTDPKDSVEYLAILNNQTDNPCAHSICEVTPQNNENTVDFTLTYPPPSEKELTNEQRRKKFEDKVDKCARDEDDKCDAINISKFVADLEDDIPNLKRSSCDASLAGGCDFDENENKAL